MIKKKINKCLTIWRGLLTVACKETYKVYPVYHLYGCPVFFLKKFKMQVSSKCANFLFVKLFNMWPLVLIVQNLSEFLWSQTVLNTLKDITKYAEWEIGRSKIRNITVAQEFQEGLSAKNKGGQPLPVQHDIISAEVEFIPSFVIRLANRLAQIVQGERILIKRRAIHRHVTYNVYIRLHASRRHR